jgi:hypothetical protein
MGVEGYELAGLEVFPNPGAGILSVKASFSDNMSVSIRNIAGELVYVYEGDPGSLGSIDLSAAAKGLYFLEVRTEKGTAKKKIVIQ